MIAARGANFAFYGQPSSTSGPGSVPSLAGGGVWIWGEGSFAKPEVSSDFSPLYGQSFNFPEPTSLAGLAGRDIVQVAAGNRHQLAVDREGRVWAWGDNAFGQLGQSDLTRYTSVVQVPGLPRVSHVAAGNRCSMAMDRTGAVYLWGNGTNFRKLMDSHLPPFPPAFGADIDGDGLPDAWELSSFGNLAQDAEGDWDGDGDINIIEFLKGARANDMTSRVTSLAVGVIGTTEAAASVNSSGAAAIRVPVKLPPGFAGPLPALSFEYNSQSDMGNCGWGWDLAGVSRITRGGTHPNRDEVRDPVDFDANDLFFLDGQRLIPVSDGSVHGGHGTEYRTESDVFSRVTSLKTSNPAVVDGPDAFIVETKAGLILRFEPPAYANPWLNGLGGLPTNFDSQGKTAHGVWLLKEATDRNGNQTLYTYIAARGLLDGSEEEVIPDEATTTLEPGVTTVRSQRAMLRPADYLLDRVYFGLNKTNRERTASFGIIRIEYRPVARPVVRFIRDRPIQNSHLVTAVTSGVVMGPFNDVLLESGTPLFEPYRRYALDYADSPVSGRQLLTRIEESGTDGQSFQKPLRFAYDHPVRLPRGRDIGTNIWPWVPGLSTALPVDVVSPAGSNNGTRLADANGDGLPDIIRQDAAWLNSAGVHGPAWSPMPYFHSPVPLFKAGATADEQKEFAAIQFIDMNGDGLPELVRPRPASIEIYLNSGTEWNLWKTIPWNLTSQQFDPRGLMLVDTNADNLPDILYHYHYAAPSSYVARAYLSKKAGTDVSWVSDTAAAPPVPLAYPQPVQRTLTADWDGDGFLDILHAWENSGMPTVQPAWTVRRGAKGAWESNTLGFVNNPRFSPILGARVIDLNADGLPDVVYASGNATVGRRAYLNTGAGFRYTPSWNLPSEIVANFNDDTANRVEFTDLNGDRLPDIYYSTAGLASPHEGAWLNTGNGFAKRDAAGASPPANMDDPVLLKLDLDGDGFLDLAKGYAPAGQSRTVYLNQSAVHETLTEFTDGFGASITFETIDRVSAGLQDDRDEPDDPPLYSMAADRQAGRRSERAPHHLVKSMTSGGNGHVSRATTYRYGGGRMDLDLHGWLGFEWFEQKDEATGVVTRTEFSQDYPYIGQPRRVVQSVGGRMVVEQLLTWQHTGGGSLPVRRYSAWPATTRESRYDLVTGGLILTKTTATAVDAFGSVTEMTVDYGGGHRETVSNTYQNETAPYWMPGQLVGARTVATLGGGSTTRVIDYGRDANARIAISRIEPSQPFALRTSGVRNHFGRETFSLQSGADMLPRAQWSEFTSDGRFTRFQANGLGHTKKAHHDPVSGLPLWRENENGLRTSHTYDGMGREIREVTPDGVVKETAYLPPGPSAPEGCGSQVVQQATGLGVAILYLDRYGREIRKESTLPDGTKSLIDTEYDAAGRIHRQSMPRLPSAAPLWFVTTYDALGRPVRVEHPNTGVTTYAHNRLTTTETNANNQRRVTTTDVNGRVLQITDHLGGTITHTYDAKGNPLTTDANGAITRRSYDARGKLLTLEDPARGRMEFHYNAAGDTIWQKDARGMVTTFDYDAAGRPVSRIRAEGAVTIEYDTAVGAGLGRPSRLLSSNGQSECLTYDGLGRLIRKVKSIHNPLRYERSDLHFEFAYDVGGRLAQLTYPNGAVARYVYGVTAEPVGLTGTRTAGGPDVVNYQARAFDAFGNATHESLGASAQTRVFRRDTGLLESASLTTGAGTRFQAGYAWDLLGNLTRRSDSAQNRTEDFTYDGLNRLQGSTLNGAPNLAVTYALNGNILTKTGQGTYTYGDPARPHAVTAVTGPGAGSFTYDASGNVLAGAGCAVSHTSFHKPMVSEDAVSGTRQEFIYGPSDEVLIQHEESAGASTRTTLYGDSLFELVIEDDDPATPGTFDRVTEQVCFAAHGRIIAVAATVSTPGGPRSETQYLHHDHLGTLIGLFDAAGTVLARYSYDAFGQRRQSNWSAGPPRPRLPTPTATRPEATLVTSPPVPPASSIWAAGFTMPPSDASSRRTLSSPTPPPPRITMPMPMSPTTR